MNSQERSQQNMGQPKYGQFVTAHVFVIGLWFVGIGCATMGWRYLAGIAMGAATMLSLARAAHRVFLEDFIPRR